MVYQALHHNLIQHIRDEQIFYKGNMYYVCYNYRSFIKLDFFIPELQCFFLSMVHVISRDELCHNWSKDSCQSSQVMYLLVLRSHYPSKGNN